MVLDEPERLDNSTSLNVCSSQGHKAQERGDSVDNLSIAKKQAESLFKT